MQELSSFETRPQRLIKTQTDKLRDFSGLTIPPFAILSHRWSLEGEVVDVDAYDPSSKAANANAEHHDDISRNFGDVNGRYSETTVFHSSTTASDADDPSKSANANAEHHGGLSRYFGDVNGGYSEQDNRKIDRNIEKCGIYCEYTVNTDSDWKTFVAGGGMATTVFYAGHMTARVEGSSMPTNNAIANIYPGYTYQFPPIVVSLVVLPVVLINLLSSLRRLF